MLDFANMVGLKEYSVEHLFSPFSRPMWVPVRPTNEKPLLKNVRVRRRATLLGGDMQSCTRSTYIRQQRELCYALKLIIDKKSISEFEDRLSHRLEAIPFQLSVVGGSLIYRFSIKTVSAGWALALVALADSDYILRHCEECDRYFVIFDARKRRQRFCSDCTIDVQREGASARQRRWRQKQRR